MTLTPPRRHLDEATVALIGVILIAIATLVFILMVTR